MPWHVAKSDTCPPGKPFAVIKNADGSTVACHATKDGATAQIRAMYANESLGGAQRMPETKEVAEQGAVLTEGAPKPGRLNVQIITPGWGASGYYSPTVLEQAASDHVFPAGTKMFLDHPTAVEQDERPNRSVKDLAAVLTEDARWSGSALVAQVRTFGPFAEAVAEMADAIGVSIRADAEVSEGEAEGRRGVLVERLTNGRSVDFVTEAGRGGRILQVLESARNDAAEQLITETTEQPAPTESPVSDDTQSSTADPADGTDAPSVTETPATEADPAAGTAEPHLSQEGHMPEEQATGGAAPPVTSRSHLERQVQEQLVINQRLMARDKARPIIAEDLALGVLTPLIVQRLTEELTEQLPMVNGDLDVVTLRDRIAKKRERAELELGEAYSLNVGTGQPRGLGGTYTVSESGRAAEFDSVTEDALARTFGLSEKAAKAAVEGR